METALHVVAMLLVAITLVPALAHALEFPGKLRLPREEYLAVQPIYYPGFTWAGFAEPLAILLTLLTALLMPFGSKPFWVGFGAFLALAAMHAVYWLRTHPVNNFWLKDTKLSPAGKAFFGAGAGSAEGAAPADWIALRDRWEHSHIIRAALALLALALLAVAIAGA
jgi:hypothetical protein